MQNFKKTALLLLSSLILTAQLQGQCAGGVNAGALTPAPVTAWQTIALTTGNYYTFTVPVVVGCSFPTYYFSFCAGDGGSAGFDSQITIRDNADVYAGGYSDDFCGLQSYVVWTPTAAGTYRVLTNTYFCGSGSGATLAYRVQNPPPADPELSLLGNAFVTGPGCATLTSAVNDQKGCVWDIDNTLDFLVPFSYDFTVNLGSNPGGADGISFVIQNSPAGRCACGVGGGSLGSNGITNSLIVEIDTYINAEDRDDGMAGVLCAGGPEPDHLDIWLNGLLNPAGAGCPAPPGARIIPAAVKLMNGGLDYDIENGLNHTLRVSWVPGAPGTLSANLWNTAITTLYGTVTHSFDPLVVFGTNTPFFGFTAATGGLNNQQSVCMPTIILAQEEVHLEAESFDGKVELNWNAPEGYHIAEIYRSGDGIDWHLLSAMATQFKQPLQKSTDENPLQGFGWYEVFLRDADGKIQPSNRVKISSVMQACFLVYPNPAEDHVNISIADFSGSAVIRLCDLLGNVLVEHATSSSEATLQTETLAPGIYMLEVRTGGKVFRQRMVKR